MMAYAAHALRVQLRRTKGWRKPAGAIVVSRPSKWGNPFKVVPSRFPIFDISLTPYGSFGRLAAPGPAADLYRWWLQHTPQGQRLLASIDQLRGRQLCCWCSLDQPCHADVLCELANA